MTNSTIEKVTPTSHFGVEARLEEIELRLDKLEKFLFKPIEPTFERTGTFAMDRNGNIIAFNGEKFELEQEKKNND